MTQNKQQSNIQTERLILRPFTLDDAKDVQRIAGDPSISDTTAQIPHPYPDELAEDWISGHPKAFNDGTSVNFALIHKETGELIGCTGLNITKAHKRAELGYWISKDVWGQGFGTEASKATLVYGFDELGLHKITAEYLRRNPASGKIMKKIGMNQEGELVGHLLKKGVYEDIIVYGIINGTEKTVQS